MKLPIIFTAIIVICGIILGIATQGANASEAGGGVNVQPNTQIDSGPQNIVDQLTVELRDAGLPIQSVRTVSFSEVTPPVVLEFTFGSASLTGDLVPGDIININTIGRRVNLAQREGLNVGGVGYQIVDAKGTTLARGIQALKSHVKLPSDFDQPSNLDDDAVNSLVRASTSIAGFNIDAIQVSRDKFGLRGVTIQVDTMDPPWFMGQVNIFVPKLRGEIDALNRSQGAQISYYRLTVTDVDGGSILEYIYDPLLKRESSWQAESVGEPWYPSPPQNSGSQ